MISFIGLLNADIAYPEETQIMVKNKKRNKKSSNTHHAYDHALKNIFAHPIMMESLIRGFVPEAWTKELDFSTLQKINVKHTTEDLHTRENDLIWKLKFRDQMLYIICLLEFQSTVDDFMAVRVLTYVGLIY